MTYKNVIAEHKHKFLNFPLLERVREPQLPSVMGQSKDLSSLQLFFSVWADSMLTEQQEALMSAYSNARTLASVADNFQKSTNNSKTRDSDETRNHLQFHVHCPLCHVIPES